MDAHLPSLLPPQRARSPSLTSTIGSTSTLSLPDDSSHPNSFGPSFDARGQPTKHRRTSNPRIRIRAEQLRTYTIDLSQPPHLRYTKICADFLSELAEFTNLYQALLEQSGFPRLVGSLAKVLLRRVYDKEEAEEIRGISKASGLPLHQVVAYNTFLDLFSGCVSGGVRSEPEGRMLHFRGLDWEMDSLRDLMVSVEYVRAGKVVARAVTYAGYVGALTGVREGLSISMNYRLRLSSNKSVFSHRMHQLSLLLGFRPSVASQLRQILLDPKPAPSLEELRTRFEKTPCTPCYLTFCSKEEVMIIENDLSTSKRKRGTPSREKPDTHNVQTSHTFLSVTNHDRAMESWSHEKWIDTLHKRGFSGSGSGVAHGIMVNSMERKECLERLWKREGQSEKGSEGKVGVEDIKRWLRTYPLRNETTHFSCIMDPSVPGGGMRWVEACEEV